MTEERGDTMVRKVFSIIAVAACASGLIMKAYGVSDTNVIYIQEDGFHSAMEMLSSMMVYLWKDIAAVTAASLCTFVMLIFVIKQRKRGK